MPKKNIRSYIVIAESGTDTAELLYIDFHNFSNVFFFSFKQFIQFFTVYVLPRELGEATTTMYFF